MQGAEERGDGRNPRADCAAQRSEAEPKKAVMDIQRTYNVVKQPKHQAYGGALERGHRNKRAGNLPLPALPSLRVSLDGRRYEP